MSVEFQRRSFTKLSWSDSDITHRTEVCKWQLGAWSPLKPDTARFGICVAMLTGSLSLKGGAQSSCHFFRETVLLPPQPLVWKMESVCLGSSLSWVIPILKVLLHSEVSVTKTASLCASVPCAAQSYERGHRGPFEDPSAKPDTGLTLSLASQRLKLKGAGSPGPAQPSLRFPLRLLPRRAEPFIGTHGLHTEFWSGSLNDLGNQALSIKCLQIEKLSRLNFVLLILPNRKARIKVWEIHKLENWCLMRADGIFLEAEQCQQQWPSFVLKPPFLEPQLLPLWWQEGDVYPSQRRRAFQPFM